MRKRIEMLAGMASIALAGGEAYAQAGPPTTTGADSVTPSAAPIAHTPQPAVQPVATSGRRSYKAEYFRQYAPLNALDLVQRVPGFQLEEIDEEVRGFGAAAGNVVINGQRPSSKTDSIQTILQRIPASRVLRVEVGSGDLFGAEFSGKPQVANLILAAGGGTRGTIEGRLLRDFAGGWRPARSFSAITRPGRIPSTAAPRSTTSSPRRRAPTASFAWATGSRPSSATRPTISSSRSARWRRRGNIAAVPTASRT